MPHITRFQMPSCRCINDDNFSDHYLLLMQTQHRLVARPHAASAVPSASSRVHNEPAFNVNLLKIDQAAKDRFHQMVTLNLDRLNTSVLDPAETLEHINRSVLSAARTSLQAPVSPQTPNRIQAGREYERCRKLLLQNRHDPVLKTQCRRARDEKYHAYLSHVDRKVQAFFDDLESQPPLEKIRLTYRFLKQFRRRTDAHSRRYLSIREWEAKLQESAGTAEIHLLPEHTAVPSGSGPTLVDVGRLTLALKNNTAAGVDGIPSELLRYGPESLMISIHQFLQKVWQLNSVPRVMIETLQVL